ncbi:M24 family metallopeptidase [Proteiniclasticum ruminis]|uniref:Xaa-Pro aminopeptidase n=1 Tax=Proteiniclasticum ruminis TaxID=398199 RepID=A0A1G8JWR3_9CLOT|nr:M24 family metallopeptidase [Proteiniclasticum ruminis]SDI35601.1 Xaa-Pro aminopeptidase [Proteiniclasticum ruminis]
MIIENQIDYEVVEDPNIALPCVQPVLPDDVYHNRLKRTLQEMSKRNLKYLMIYADREHYGNFEYLTGYGPRFEEALLIVDQSGESYTLLGNECLGMAKQSRITTEGILFHAFSLPNQPIHDNKTLKEILRYIGVDANVRVGMAGWKLLYPDFGTRQDFDVPSFIVDKVKEVTGEGSLENVTDLFIDPQYGLRVINTAHDIAYFEFGAAYASDAVLNMLRHTRTGLTEIEVSQYSTSGSLPTSLFPKVLAGERMDLGMVSPTTNKLKLGDRFQVSMGLIGGQSNRRGFAVYSEADLPEESRDFLDKIAKPYFTVMVNWYENMQIGVKGSEIYQMVEETYPRNVHGWFLNPGHLISTEEWMSSPIYEGSEITMKSGMILQMDIIPFLEKIYAAPNCEDGIAIGDEKLREEIKTLYPEVYGRIMARREFMEKKLNIRLKPEVLPLSNITGLYRPYMLNKDKAFVIRRED